MNNEGIKCECDNYIDLDQDCVTQMDFVQTVMNLVVSYKHGVS